MPDDADADGDVRVAVYFATERESAAAEAILGDDAERFANVVQGTVDADGLVALDESGLIVEQLAGAGPPPGPTWDPDMSDAVTQLQEEADAAPLHTPPGGTGALDASPDGTGGAGGSDDLAPSLAGDAAAPAPSSEPAPEPAPQGDFYRIELRGPITREQRDEFVALGVAIAAFEPPSHYRTFLTDEQRRRVEALDHVAGLTPYTFEEKLTPELVALVDEQTSGGPALAGDPGGDGPGEELLFDCLVHREADLAHVRDLIAATGTARVVGTSNLRVRFSAPVDVAFLGALAGRTEVRQLTVFTPPTLTERGDRP